MIPLFLFAHLFLGIATGFAIAYLSGKRQGHLIAKWIIWAIAFACPFIYVSITSYIGSKTSIPDWASSLGAFAALVSAALAYLALLKGKEARERRRQSLDDS